MNDKTKNNQPKFAICIGAIDDDNEFYPNFTIPGFDDRFAASAAINLIIADTVAMHNAHSTNQKDPFRWYAEPSTYRDSNDWPTDGSIYYIEGGQRDERIRMKIVEELAPDDIENIRRAIMQI